MNDAASPFEKQVTMADPSSEAENSQGDSNSQDMQVKDEPEDNGYEQTSSANSRTSSPLPPVHFGITSPSQSNVSPSAYQIENNENNECNNHQNPLIGSPFQGSKVEKKMNTVQNIVEGLRRKSETQLAKSKCDEQGPNSFKSKSALESVLKRHEPAFPPHGQSNIFPISQNLQARVTCGRKNVSKQFKQIIARPKSPTGKSHGLLKDLTHFTYSMMESPIDDNEAVEIFNVQNHELVCAIGSKPLMSSKSNKVFASLDFGFYWCNFCPYTSSNKTALIQHVLEHRFSCKYCPYESFCRSDTMRHMHKMHSDFGESANRFVYCTLLSDFMRIKARIQMKTDKDSDEDVGDPDANDIEALSNDYTSRKRKHAEDNLSDIKSVRSSLESPSATPTWSDSESSSKEKGKSRKSQNPKRHAPSSHIEHFDLFDVEVEEKKCQQRGNVSSDKTLTLAKSSLPNSESQTLPPGTMQVLPTMTDGSLQTFTSEEAKPQTSTPSQAPKANFSYRGRKNVTATGSASNLYWSCGYCTFQSNGQSEIKEHSNKQHPGKPHRYVALIKNMTPDTYIPHGTPSANVKRSSYRPALSIPQTNGARNSMEYENIIPQKNKEELPDLLNAKITSTKLKRENTIYRCYHCSYTAKRHSSLKTHIYHKHRGKGLVAVEDESETGQQLFFCARDDCTFKTDNPNMYLNHVDQCTPWNKPELADVEVEPHIRECLDQTIAFAETAREKVNNQCFYETAAEVDQGVAMTGCERELQSLRCVINSSVSPESQGESAVMEESGVSLSFDFDYSELDKSAERVCNQDSITSHTVDSKPHPQCSEPVHIEGKDICQSSSVEVDKAFQPSDSLLVEAISFEDSGHIDLNDIDSIEDSSLDNLKHSMSSQGSFIAVGVLNRPFIKETDAFIGDGSNMSVDETFVSPEKEISLDLNDIVHEACANRDQSQLVCQSVSFEKSKSTFKSNEDILMIDRMFHADGLSKASDLLHIKDSELSDMTVSEDAGDNFSEEKRGTEDEGNSLYPLSTDKNTLEYREKIIKPVESKWLIDLIDSTDNTDSEESGITLKPSVPDSQKLKLKNVLPERFENICKEDKTITEVSKSLELDQHQKCKTSKHLKQHRHASVEPFRGTNLTERESPNKLCFAYVPARTSAQKALSKMKSTLADECESVKMLDTEIRKIKQLPLKTKKTSMKFVKASGKAPMLPPRNSLGSSLPSSSSLSRSKSTPTMYMCQYCLDIHPSSLKKVKTHLQLEHKNMPPSVINCSYQKRQKKCRLFVCPYPSCFKLFFTTKDLDNHKNTHQTNSTKKSKERTTFNSSSCATANSNFVQDACVIPKTKISTSSDPPQPSEKTSSKVTPSSMPEIRSCRVKLHNLGVSDVQAITQRHKREGKYLCLYCTEYVYESSLSAMKSHYIHEHEGQLMVMRDTEARKAQLPSRIYVCDSPGCEHKCISKHELDAHIRSEHHTSSCSYVYQCVLCGWFSSSHVSANQHLVSQHSPDEGASLVHMQVMVDEFGQTSKKVV